MIAIRIANVLFLLYLLLVVSLVTVGSIYLLLRIPFSWKRLLTIWGVNVAGRMISFVLFSSSSEVTAIITVLTILFQDYCILGLRRRSLAIGFVLHVAIGVSQDYFVLLFTHLLGMDIGASMVYDTGTSQALRTISSIPAYSLAVLLGNAVVMALIALFYFTFRRMRQNNRWAKLRALRPILLTIALVAFTIYFLSQTDRRILYHGEVALQALKDTLPIFVMMFVLFFYIVQDWRALSLSKQNRSLTQQQRMYDVLLADTRLFRHNIANMLFGFAGAVLSGDTADIQAYYSDLARKCAAINNENAVALSLVPSGAVRSFLLNKIKMADACSVPLYINVSEDIRWKSPADSDMCEMLGVLIDNALEAAKDAAAPYAAVEISNTDHAMEILIRNTYAHDADLSFLRGEPGSSKPGHEGIGLAGVRRLLSRKASVIINQLQRGRYIETSLLFY